MSEIIIYQSAENETKIEVTLDNETVWLSQTQMATLFGKGRTTITEHIRNIFLEEELEQELVCRDFRHTTEHGAIQGKTQTTSTTFYNLDVVISVGYRVKSKQGTQFRQWASQRLKDYLVKGFVLNEQKLRSAEQQLVSLKEGIRLLENVVQRKELSSDEATGLLKIVSEYARALDLLDQYDHQLLRIEENSAKSLNKLTYPEAIAQINLWRDKQNAGKLFGNEKDKSFHSSYRNYLPIFRWD
ncbi:MAG: RhuM family protein [Bacteroidota bacterium]